MLGPRVQEGVVDYSIADKLAALTCERGFDGWLVNVEVPLSTPAHVRSLQSWLRHFRDELHRMVPDSELMWYDGVNTQGEVRWQNALTDLNKPFLDCCDTIFLNYGWQPEEPARFAKSSSEDLIKRVVFGVDVYGRGQYGGGRFDTWRALECIDRARGENDARVSFALFAPGWTVESEHLGNNLSTVEGWHKWWQDERYLWTGGPEPSPGAKTMQRVVEDEQRLARGVERARAIASALSSSERRPLPPFDYHSPLPPLPGTFRPISSFVARRAPPQTASWYTNFSCGSGHYFYLESQRVHSPMQGWTDVDFSFPMPDLLPVATFDDDEGWFGARSLLLPLLGDDPAVTIPLCSINVAAKAGCSLTMECVWKSDIRNTSVEPIFLVDISSQPEGTYEQVELAHGWRRTRGTMSTSQATVFQRAAVRVTSSSTSIRIGSLSIRHSSSPVSTGVRDLRWSGAQARLSWTSTSPPPMFFIVWQYDASGSRRLVARTSDTCIDITGALQGSALAVQAFYEEGTIGREERTALNGI